MITKTYLDSRLASLEEKIEKKIDFKVGQAVQRRENSISRIEEKLKKLEEKIFERRDIDEKQDENNSLLSEQLESLKARLEKLEEKIGKNGREVNETIIKKEADKNNPGIITPDEV